MTHEEKQNIDEMLVSKIKEAFFAGYEQGEANQISYRDLVDEAKEDVDIVLANILAYLDKPLTDKE